MKITRSILIVLLMVPCFAFGEDQLAEQQTPNLDKLLNRYEAPKPASVATQDPQSEIRKLRSQLIDLRVERDALTEENAYLKNKLQSVRAFEEEHPECIDTGCVPVNDVQKQKIVTYVIYSLGLYRMAEVVVENTPIENVEAHKQAQNIMAGVKSDLEVLGFDTANMHDYPTLDELLTEFETVKQESLTQ